jgi:hypothetical protein
MTETLAAAALQQHVDDELLRAPLLFDQVVEGTLSAISQALPSIGPLQRTALSDLVQSLRARQPQLAEYFTRSLREQAAQFAAGRESRTAGTAAPRLSANSPSALSLVDEDEVAVDVQIAHTIEAIRSIAEYELRELQTFTAALVGDMHMAGDHNPFGAEAYARALWAAAQALPLARGHQVAFMRHAAEPLARVLRQSYAAAASRLEAMGIEPAAYRTLILPPGSRRRRGGPGMGVETTFSPDLGRVREQLPPHPTIAAPLSPSAGARLPSRADRQAQELVERLFEAIRADDRVPADVLGLIVRLQGPALRLAQNEAQALENDAHPLWVFVNRLAYEAEMTPADGDPERVRLLKLAQQLIQQVSAEPEQRSGLYRWAGERLDTFLRQRLARRCTTLASQIGALQKLEDKLTVENATPSTMHGTLDVPQLDTVPAELLPDTPAPPDDGDEGARWLETLRAGDWLRLFLQGRWVHAQLLWPGERRELWLFGDGGSDTTWAVRRGALLALREARLLKGLTRRSLVRRAARQLHQQLRTTDA